VERVLKASRRLLRRAGPHPELLNQEAEVLQDGAGMTRPSLEWIGCTWSYLTFTIGYLVPNCWL
jgi:hypothetical protein